MKNVLKLAIFLGCILLLFGVGVVASYLQGQLFVHNPASGRSDESRTPADYQMVYESLELQTQDGFRLAAWYVPSQNGAAVIMVHGHKANRADVLTRAQVIARHGYGVLLLDLRAHGKSEGDLITFGLKEAQDIDAAYRYLLTRSDVDAHRIGAIGCSMGGAVVILSAAQNTEIKVVVSESAFANLSDGVPSAISETGLPPILFAPIVQWFAEREIGFKAEQISPMDYIGKISPRPVFIIHGGKDLVVMPDSGQRLYNAAGEPRELWFEPDLGHVEFINTLPDEYERRVIKFLDHYLLKK